METNRNAYTTQVIKATTAKQFLEQLSSMSKTLTNRTMAYLGLWNEGALLDTTGNQETLEALKVGEKLEIAMSAETRACNPCLVKSIHLVGDDIICNGAENLFAYPQAEEIIRDVASFLRQTGAKNVILGGTPTGHGCWLLPKNGTPVTLSSFGWGWVLPYEGYLLTRDVVGGGCYYLAPECLQKHQLARQYWTNFYTPKADGQVVSFGHRVRDGYLYATIRRGNQTTVEAWNLRPLLDRKNIVTNPVDVRPEWQTAWGTEIVGPVEQGNAIAIVSPNMTGVTFFGVQAPTTQTPRA